jgi:hypothetical protein
MSELTMWGLRIEDGRVVMTGTQEECETMAGHMRARGHRVWVVYLK